jgi:hypothetical protein
MSMSMERVHLFVSKEIVFYLKAENAFTSLKAMLIRK